jgi:DNA-binding transcriptional ArsR family regulator
MEAVLWYVLTGTRGGENRVRLLRAIDERPRNANRLAEALELDYKTVRHHLEAGLHTDVHVRLSDPLEEDAAVYAVVYRDSDGDGTFEFDDSAGAVDRPYTVTYDPETGGISDDAGDVVGDAAAVTVVDAPVVAGAAARDLDGDGRYEDVNGDGRATVADVQALFANWDTPPVQNDPAAFDFNADGRVSMADVQRLFVAVRG